LTYNIITDQKCRKTSLQAKVATNKKVLQEKALSFISGCLEVLMFLSLSLSRSLCVSICKTRETKLQTADEEGLRIVST
jgi:hypothetical protein